MASLLLGAAGGFLFGPIGFIAGSLIGNLLFPQKQEGPRLSNLKLQGSSYGQMIPLPYGTIRLAGQIVWQTDLTEHKHTQGGKGGPEVTTFSYTASFAVKICKGPVKGLLQIFANGTLIYDTSTGSTTDNTAVPLTFYKGEEDALPDPTMEAVLGVGNVPAFRDDAVAVFTDWDLSQYGNMLPQLSFVIYTNVGGQIPERINTWDVFSAGNGPWGLFGGPCGCVLDTDGTLLIAHYYYAGTGTPPLSYTNDRFDIDGTPLGNVTTINPVSDPHGGILTLWYQLQNSNIAYLHTFDGTHVYGAWYTDGVRTADLGIVSGLGDPVYAPGYYANDFIYVTGGPPGAGFVGKWAATGGIATGTSPVATYLLDDAQRGDHYDTTVDENGDVWVTGTSGTGFYPPLWHFDEDLNLIHYWSLGTGPRYAVNSWQGFAAYGGFLAYRNNTDAGNNVIVYKVETDLTFTVIGQAASTFGGGIVRLQGCTCICDDGRFSICPEPAAVTLASIVSDLSVRSGLATSDIDVSQLTDIVDGYLITTRTDARTDIDQLRTAYFFDAVESQGKAKFVKRGGAVAVTIPDDDLSARPGGDDPPPLVEVQREQELDLVAEVDVKYINVGASYQDGAQQAIRQSTLSQAVADVSLAIAMSDAKARQIANVLLYQTIVERDSGVFRTSRKYLYLEPTDVVKAHGYTMRIEKKTALTNGIVEFEGKFTIPAIYVVALASNATTGSGPPPQPPISQATALLLLDIPLVSDLDEQQAIYAAMAGVVDGTWRGATLYRSSDGGTTYAAVTSTSVAAVMGTTQDVLADFGGGNMFDESSHVSVLIGAGGGTLSSANELAVLNGANIALVGSELLQYKNATLTAPSTYALSGFLRGRRGTEWHTRGHIAGERFVALPVLDVPSPFNDLGQQRQYKPVTSGSSLAATSAISFVDTGAALMPYAPTNVFGGIDSSGNVVIDWTRRTRIGGAWVDFTDVPLSEPSELYVLQVWNADYTLCARVVTGLTSPTFTYTSAMQVTDFGATQQTIYITVGQIGSYGLGVQTAAVIAGTGASVDTPLNPQTPYNTVPPTTPSGPGCVVAGSVITSVMTWSNGFAVLSGAFTPDDVWVIKFTTPASFGGSGGGGIDAFEFGGPQSFRSWSMSLGPCGPLLPGSIPRNDMEIHQGFRFGSNPNPQTRPTLLPNTTYYLSVFTEQASPMQAVLAITLDP
jgi:hypothetical protein